MHVPGAASHDGHTADQDAIGEVLADAVRIIEQAGIPYVIIGGTASFVHGRARCSGDIDFLVRPADAPRVLEALEHEGFETERTNEHWLYKAFRDGVLVDVLFRSSGDIFLDDEMLARSLEREFRGTRLRLVPPEDLIVIKAIAYDEQTPRHWYDALGVIASSELDWEYLLRRARRAPRRVLSLLVYATSDDLLVPTRVIRRLHDAVFGEGTNGRPV
jgi:predicted nucleotidyltransferase